MLIDFICPRGHRWQTQESQTGATECPECGVNGDRFEPTMQPSHDEGTIDATAEFTRAGGGPGIDSPRPQAEDIPPTIPGYEVLECLGRGGMGAVYRAVDSKLQRQVAVKVVALGPNPRQEDLLRFQIEAESLASMQHPNVVQVYEVGEIGRQPYLAMELVDGPSLEGYLKEHALTPREAAAMCAKIAMAVHATHQRGIVHRDLKPANILIAESDEPKLTDFGLAKRIETDSAITRPGMVVGTPSYMAPEQAEGESSSVGPRSDVYSLGAVLYEMICGRKPFVADSVLRTLEMIRAEEPSPLSRYVKSMPRDLETICLKCLEKTPDRRYDTAGELAADLQRFLRGEPVVARPLGIWERGLKWTRRRPALAASIALVAFGIVAGSLGAVWHHRQIVVERDAARESHDLARNAIHVLLVQIAEENFSNNPHMDMKKEDMLTQALEYYELLYENRKQSASAQVEVAEAQIRLGDVYRWLDRDSSDLDRSLESYQQGIDVLHESPSSESKALWLGNAHQGLGQLLYKTGRLESAEEAFHLAIDGYDQLLNKDADNDDLRAEVASCYQHLANCLIDTNRAAEAEEYLTAAIRSLEAIAMRDNDDLKHLHKLAQSHLTLGNLLRQLSRHEKVEDAYSRAIELFAQLHKKEPNNAIYHSHLAQATANLGNHHMTQGNLDEAEDLYQRAQNELVELVDKYESTAEYRQAAANTLNSLAAVHYHRASQAEEQQKQLHLSAASAKLEEAIEHQRELIRSHPDRADFQGDLGMAQGNLAALHLEKGDLQAAKTLLDAAISALAKARAKLPDHPDYLAAAEYQYDLLASALIGLNDFESALEQARKCQQMAEADTSDSRLALAYFNRLLLDIDQLPPDRGQQQLAFIEEVSSLGRNVTQLALHQQAIDRATIETAGNYDGLKPLLADPARSP